jgi:hypothetical protein
MISQKLRKELVTIIKQEFDQDLSEQEILVLSQKLIHFGEILTDSKYRRRGRE